MDIDVCAPEELFAAFARDEVDAAQRALLWAHAAKCPRCAASLQAIAVAEDEAVGTMIDTSGDLGDSGDEEFQERKPAEYTRGDTIGRYMVIEELGSGGLGLVFLAYDPDLDRRVAIKVLRATASRSSDATLHQIRLMREAKAMAQFSHPNIVTVHDVGVANGEVFIAMEYIDGAGLRQWVSQNRPTWQDVRDVMLEAARALTVAHASGLVHRDFKPSNVMVTPDGQVKVLDFGLARNIATRQDAEASVALDDIDFSDPNAEFMTPEPLSRAAALDEPLTQSGQLMGTPGYMPPEQYDARQLVDARSDQFAFCVTLHEVLYRRRPYRGKSFEEVREATRSGTISPPPEDIVIPDWLRAVVHRGISVDAADRFADMEELSEALTQDLRQTQRKWGGVAAGFSLSAVFGAGAMFLWSPTPVPEEIQAVEALVAAARDAAAESYYVYPPADAPDTPTAYRRVLELEAVDGAAEALADEKAVELRGTFADTLERLGDDYWDRPGGKGFAADYYAAALVFDASRTRASERTGLTPGQLALFEKRAGEGGFSDGELRAAGYLVALAEEDEGERMAKLQAQYENQAPSFAAASNLTALLGEEDMRRIAGPSKVRRGAGVVKEGDAAGEDVDPAQGEDGAEEPVPVDLEEDALEGELLDESVRGKSASKGESEAARVARKAEAKKRAKQGQQAFRSNQLDRAATFFHQALELDSSSRVALEGMAELSFERGKYSDALRYGKKAVRRSPKKGSLRILLGDAYYKTVNYAAARKEYEKAKELKHRDASGRLARLNKKQGK